MKKTINNTGSVDDAVIIKELKQALLASQNNFKQLFNNTSVPKWIYNRDSLWLLQVNEAALKKYEYTEEEFLKMTILKMSPRKEIQKLILYNEFMKTTRESFSVMGFHRKKNGEKIHVETTYVNIEYKEKACVLVSSIDVDEKIKLHEKITLLGVNRQQKITLAVINGQEKERDDIGKELHENISQLLATAKIYMGLAHTNGSEGISFIGQAEKILVHAINDIRALSNSLIPSTLKMISFKQSLNSLFETYLLSNKIRINSVTIQL